MSFSGTSRVPEGPKPTPSIPLFDVTQGIPALRRELRRRGIVLLRVDPGDVAGCELRRIVAALGKADPHCGDDQELWHIRCVAGAGKQPSARSQTADPFPFHTDGSFEDPPPDYIALYVVQHDQVGGGVTLFLSVQTVLKRISTEERHILSATRFRFRVPSEFNKGVPYRDLSVLLRRGRVRYRREIIDESVCTPTQIRAMDEFDAAIATAQPMRFSLESGMIVIFDNASFLHARTEVLDPERHLLRMRFSQ